MSYANMILYCAVLPSYEPAEEKKKRKEEEKRKAETITTKDRNYSKTLNDLIKHS